MLEENNQSNFNPKSDSAQELRSAFLASVTHEFRTPLASLNASVEYMLDEFSHLNKDEIRELLKSVHLSVIGLQTLIDNLIESLTIEAGRFVIHQEFTDLEAIINEAIQIVTPLLSRRGQRVLVENIVNLPPIYADSTRIIQVLVNLLSNASKYGPMDQTIWLRLTREKDQMLRVAISDQGPGIPKAERNKLFQRFSRLESPDGPQYGIGLGLSVVKFIIDQHGGQVALDDAPGGGTVFYFSLPLVE